MPEASSDSRRRERQAAAAAYASNQLANQLGDERANFQDRNATQASQTGAAAALNANARATSGIVGGDVGSRMREEQLADLMRRRAMGQAPSIAQQQATLGAQDAARNALALAATGRGNPGAALNRAQGVAGNAAVDATRAGIIGRLQEQQQAEQGLSGLLQGMRSADVQKGITQAQLDTGTSQFNAGQSNDAALKRADLLQQIEMANLDARTKQRLMDDAMRNSLLSGQQGALGIAAGQPGAGPRTTAMDYITSLAGPLALLA